jgi:hypothetical protein
VITTLLAGNFAIATFISLDDLRLSALVMKSDVAKPADISKPAANSAMVSPQAAC